MSLVKLIPSIPSAGDLQHPHHPASCVCAFPSVSPGAKYGILGVGQFKRGRARHWMQMNLSPKSGKCFMSIDASQDKKAKREVL